MINSSSFLIFAIDAEFVLRVSGNEDESTGEEIDGQLRKRRIVPTRSMVPPAGGNKMSLRLSTVGVEIGSCWSKRLIMVVFCVQMRNLLVSIVNDSLFYHIFAILINSALMLLPL